MKLGRVGQPGSVVSVRSIAIAILLLWAARLFITESPVADWIVAPLLIADAPEASQAVVVLGAGTVEGCVPNNNGVRRVLLAARMLREGKAPLLIFTGGTGDGCPVARAMSLLARQVGVPAEAIREEAASTSTWENGALTAPLLRAWGIHRVLIVTDRLHMRRATGVFRRLGFDVRQASVPIVEGHRDNLDMLQTGLREFAALSYYRLRGWIGSPDTPGSTTSTAAEYPRQTMKGTGPIVLLGASYPEGWQLGEIAGVKVVNRGVGGEQSFEMLARFDSDVVAEEPRAVILWGFINDVFHAPADTEPALQRVRESFGEMIARARQNGIVPVLATELTIRAPSGTRLEPLWNIIGTLRGKESYQDRINSHVLGLNKWIVETAKREQLLVLEFQAVLSEPNGQRRPAFAQPDGSHISQQGYDMLTSYAVPILEQVLVER
jgi:uncharacterized SAM-binding protein YcdF (DUF218 family)/lysophospholipase L1-like esterase